MYPSTKPTRIDPRITIELLKDLIRIPSVNPSIEQSYDEAAIASFIAKWFRKTKQFRVVEQSVKGSRFNVIATLEGKGHGKSLMLNGHMDTVGVSYVKGKPFRPTFKAGRMYGRGSCDMKGALAAMMSTMLALAISKTPLLGDLTFTGVVDEEFRSIGTAELVKRVRSDAAIVGEPTNMNIAIAHKGYAWLEVQVIGREAHGSVPERGIDAIENMSKLLMQLDSLRKQYRRARHRLVGTPKIHASTVQGGTEWSTVPGKCVLHIERRLVPGERASDAVSEIRELIRGVARKNPEIRAEVRLIHHADPMEVPAGSPVVKLLTRNVKRMSRGGKVIGAPYWTDAAILVNKAKIPSCLFGPGDINVAHSSNESVRVRDVITTAEVYALTAEKFCQI
jgi:acetylornithine deacetylase/succinyl-diaminopimelate desuccinylase family protein